MENLDRYISTLLFDHDCVIVPALGGFLASDIPSSIHPSRHTIDPPYRKIAFNVYLKQNDGLLASHLVEYEGMTYPEALRAIEQYVSNCFRTLDREKKVVLDRIGVLSYDAGRNLQFEPYSQFNYRLDAFGMSPVHYLPVQRDEIRPAKTSKETLRPSLPSAPKVTVRHKQLLGILAVTGAIAWFSLNLYLVTPRHSQSSLNPFTANAPLPAVKETKVPPSQVETVYVRSTPVDSVRTETPAPAAPTAQTAAPKPVAAPTVSTVTPTAPAGGYTVIAGAFRIRENADKLVLELRSQGYPSAAAFDKGNLRMVSYNRFENRGEAVALLDSLRANKREGWILR